MADKKISALDAASTLAGTDLIPVVQAVATGQPKKATLSLLPALLADWLAQAFKNFKAELVTEAGTAITLSQATHGGRVVRTSSGSAVTITVPNTLPVGFTVTIIQRGAGQITFATSGGMVISNRQSHTKTAAQNAVVSLLVDATNTAVLAGDTAA